MANTDNRPGLGGTMRRLWPAVGRGEAVRRVIAEDRVALHYQPVVHLRSGRVHHYEVLARPEGAGSTLAWVKSAESLGLVEAFDLLVCRKAAAELARRGEVWGETLAVNLSARSLASAAFVDNLQAALAEWPGRPLRMLFEVTGSAEIKDFAAVDEAIQALRGAGYPVCLDGFCAGIASFRYLQAAGVDFVKIDGAYVRRAERAARDFAMLKAMVALCRDLGRATVASKVETAGQAAMLRDLGLDYGQGFHFARPTAEPCLPQAMAATGPAPMTLIQAAAGV